MDLKIRLLPVILAALALPVLAGCAGESAADPPAVPETEISAEVGTEDSAAEIPLAENGKTDFRLVYDVDVAPEVRNLYFGIRDAFRDRLWAELAPYDDYQKELPCEIVVDSGRREICANLQKELKEGEFAIRAVRREDGGMTVALACRGNYARLAVVGVFIDECIEKRGGVIPEDLTLKGELTMKDAIVTSTIPQLRDPCILVENGIYYAYGTGWHCWKNDSGSLSGRFADLGVCVEIPGDAETNFWAPEVHRYGGKFYMFTTYKSKTTGHRGCSVFVSDKPEGPFREITDGHATPKDWDSIDGTFDVDEDRQPGMVFVHEWTSTDDGCGRMAAAKLSDDLTHFVSEPVELFRADDPAWATNKVTDGCWMYRCSTGELLMLWSNWDSAGYCVGIARSDNGRVDGKWSQDKALLYSKAMTGDWDGGHGMLFTDTDGQMYLSIHSPNNATDARRDVPIFIPVKERDGTLVWDIRR